jgi:hypothetical protein
MRALGVFHTRYRGTPPVTSGLANCSAGGTIGSAGASFVLDVLAHGPGPRGPLTHRRARLQRIASALSCSSVTTAWRYARWASGLSWRLAGGSLGVGVGMAWPFCGRGAVGQAYHRRRRHGSGWGGPGARWPEALVFAFFLYTFCEEYMHTFCKRVIDRQQRRCLKPPARRTIGSVSRSLPQPSAKKTLSHGAWGYMF